MIGKGLVFVFLVVLAAGAHAWPAILQGNETLHFPMVVYHGGVLTPMPAPIVPQTPGEDCTTYGVLTCVTVSS